MIGLGGQLDASDHAPPQGVEGKKMAMSSLGGASKCESDRRGSAVRGQRFGF